MEAIASRLEAIASRLEAIAIRNKEKEQEERSNRNSHCLSLDTTTSISSLACKPFGRLLTDRKETGHGSLLYTKNPGLKWKWSVLCYGREIQASFQIPGIEQLSYVTNIYIYMYNYTFKKRNSSPEIRIRNPCFGEYEKEYEKYIMKKIQKL